MDVSRFKSKEEADEVLAKELLHYTTQKLPRYVWLLTGAAVGEDSNRPRGAG